MPVELEPSPRIESKAKPSRQRAKKVGEQVLKSSRKSEKINPADLAPRATLTDEEISVHGVSQQLIPEAPKPFMKQHAEWFSAVFGNEHGQEIVDFKPAARDRLVSILGTKLGGKDAERKLSNPELAMERKTYLNLFAGGMSYGEVAKETQQPVDAVRRELHHIGDEIHAALYDPKAPIAVPELLQLIANPKK